MAGMNGSVLFNRILYQDQANNDFSSQHLTSHPRAPLIPNVKGPAPRGPVPGSIHYTTFTYSSNDLYFQAAQPQYRVTGDVNAAPAPATDNGNWDRVVPAGRP
jgi:hypothetical protein